MKIAKYTLFQAEISICWSVPALCLLQAWLACWSLARSVGSSATIQAALCQGPGAGGEFGSRDKRGDRVPPAIPLIYFPWRSGEHEPRLPQVPRSPRQSQKRLGLLAFPGDGKAVALGLIVENAVRRYVTYSAGRPCA